MKDKLFLVDGSAYLFRAYHALPSLTNSLGQATGAVYGINNMIRNLLRDYQPEYIAVVFDSPKPNFRRQLYAEYKANRAATPSELVGQIEFAKRIIAAWGLPVLTIDGVEADDVIATLAVQAEQLAMTCIIFTSDKDLAQVVTDNIHLVDTMRHSIIDVAGVKAKFGVYPKQIVDYLSLVGDSADNVVGVKKVGSKTAARWLCEYGSLDMLLQQAHTIKGKVGENLRLSKDILSLNKQLLSVKTDLKLDYTPQQLRLNPIQNAELFKLYQELEFKNLPPEAQNCRGARPCVSKTQNAQNFMDAQDAQNTQNFIDAQDAQNKQNFMDAQDAQNAQNFMDAQDAQNTQNFMDAQDAQNTQNFMDAQDAQNCCRDARPCASTIIIEPVTEINDLIALVISSSENEILYISKNQLHKLQPILENANIAKIGHNLKFTSHLLANYGIKLAGIQHDIMLLSYVLDSAAKHDLPSLAHKHLAVQITNLPPEDKAEKAEYAAQNINIIRQLKNILWEQLSVDTHHRMSLLYQNMEIPLITVLVNMEKSGISLDIAKLRAYSAELSTHIQQLSQQAQSIAQTEFNLNSPKQLQQILFKNLNLPVIKKTAKGEPSTAVEVLEELAKQHELPQIILTYRSLSKLKSTYTDSLIAQVKPHTNRVHTSYQQAVTLTGRLSSINPNLQNIPIRTAEGRQIRQAFIAPPNYVLMSCDYSQIELRIMAHLSQDEKLLNAFAHNMDIHQATAAEVFALAPDQVSQEQRRRAKAVNFGLIYGMQAFGLAKQLGIEHQEAQIYIDTYFQRYPKVKLFMDNMRALAQEQGFVETICGRRLYLHDIKANNYQLKQYAQRSAINAPMQGSAADIIKLAMLAVHDWINAQQLDIRMLLQVHDELVFEVAENDLILAKKYIPQLMSKAVETHGRVSLTVPLVVSTGVGKNWDAAH
jgi:DNA polymerase I